MVLVADRPPNQAIRSSGYADPPPTRDTVVIVIDLTLLVAGRWTAHPPETAHG